MMEDALRKKLLRMQERVDQLETIIEDRSREMFVVNERLQASSAFLEELYRTMPSALLILDERGNVESANMAAAMLLEYPSCDALTGKPMVEIFARGADAIDSSEGLQRTETTLLTRGSRQVPVLLSTSSMPRGERGLVRICVAVDLRDRKQLEIELRHAQKLESVGRLAAGIAHEINTPTQFVSDSVHFVREAVEDLFRLLVEHEALCSSVSGTEEGVALAESVAAVADEIDLPYIRENLPKSLDRALDGLGRIASIVRSMKEFAHPDQREMTAINLNQAIDSTLTIARNEYKYVADLETSYADIPPVTCHAGDVNQAILNLVVNAAHAISDVVRGSTQKGRIQVGTRREGNQVVITVRDSGGGIPEHAREHIFDPFFTTKEVGRGTGQGLAIARSVVVDKHGGAITFDTTLGEGTTFTIRLPIDGRRRLTQEFAA